MKKKGITLIELIAAIAILSIVLSMVYGTFESTNKLNKNMITKNDLQNSLDLVCDALEKDFREAKKVILPTQQGEFSDIYLKQSATKVEKDSAAKIICFVQPTDRSLPPYFITELSNKNGTVLKKIYLQKDNRTIKQRLDIVYKARNLKMLQDIEDVVETKDILSAIKTIIEKISTESYASVIDMQNALSREKHIIKNLESSIENNGGDSNIKSGYSNIKYQYYVTPSNDIKYYAYAKQDGNEYYMKLQENETFEYTNLKENNINKQSTILQDKIINNDNGADAISLEYVEENLLRVKADANLKSSTMQLTATIHVPNGGN